MRIKTTKFGGTAPGVSARLLNDQFAQVAENVDLVSGALTPIYTDSDVYTLQTSTRRSIFLYNDTYWLEWAAERVSAVKSPLPNDAYNRLYFTGDGYPRMGTALSMISGSSGYPAVSYRLGVPAPANAPGVTKGGTVEATEIPNTVTYVYTFVTDYGEEGPPSDPSEQLDITSTETVTVSMPAPDNPSGNYSFATNGRKRIYRANTGSSTTEYQFVAEVSLATTSYVDTTPSAELSEVLPSASWLGPPDDNASLYPDGPMIGLTYVANGILAGFTGNRLCISEPYLPHAWPVEYQKTFDFNIVGIVAASNGILVVTKGAPSFVAGVDPSAMAVTKLPIAQSCINVDSIVDMGDYAMYAGPDGLVKISPNEGSVVTEGLISPRQWNTDYKPSIIKAAEYEGTYVALWSEGGAQGGWVFDPRNTEAALTTLTVSAEVRGVWSNPTDGSLYMIVGDKIKKYRAGATPKTASWKSKKHVTPMPASFRWVGVHAENYPVTVKVWCDNALIADYSLSKSGSVYTQTTTVPSGTPTVAIGPRPVMRMPAVVGQVWEVQVSSQYVIHEIILAQSAEEIAGIE